MFSRLVRRSHSPVYGTGGKNQMETSFTCCTIFAFVFRICAKNSAEKLKKTLPVVGFTFGIRDALESLAGR